MLNFFRKHQRIFFIVIGIVVVLSFSFFGTYSATTTATEAPDRTIGKALDGSSITLREVDAITRFLSSGYEDGQLLTPGRFPNLLNGSFVHKELLTTGLGLMLAEQYFDQLQDELQIRLQKAKAFRSYAHPQAPFLSAEAVWSHFSPLFVQHLETLRQSGPQATKQTLALLNALYMDQASFPPQFLQRVLSYQQSQYNWIQQDPELNRGNLSLFEFHSLEDWFGHKFLECVSQFLINSSILAQQKGYSVSDVEARTELYRNVYTAFQALSPKGEYSAKDVDEYFRQQLRLLNLDESSAVKITKKILLFKRLFNEAGNAVFLDALPYQKFASYAEEGLSVDLYQLPSDLRLHDFRSLLKFQFYLDAVSAPKSRSGSLSLPKQLLSVEELEKKFPQLVQRRFELEFASADKEELALSVGLKETWDWETDENHWTLLRQEFPVLATKKGDTKEERFASLDGLDHSTRMKIDVFARDKILDSRPMLLQEALEKAPVQKQTVSIRSQGGALPFDGVSDPTRLLKLLQSSSPEAKSELALFTEDGQHFYRITVLDNASHKEIVTFAEASRDDTLSHLLDKRLEAAYPDVRKKEPALFQLEEGNWKPFKDVKDEVGARVYADLLKAIREQTGEKNPTLESYAAHRLDAYMQEAKKHLAVEPEDPQWIHTSSTKPTATEQWLLQKTRTELKRSAHPNLAIGLAEGAWSEIQTSTTGDSSFFRVLAKQASSAPSKEEIAQGQQLLSVDAKRALMQQTLELLSQKKAIAL